MRLEQPNNPTLLGMLGNAASVDLYKSLISLNDLERSESPRRTTTPFFTLYPHRPKAPQSVSSVLIFAGFSQAIHKHAWLTPDRLGALRDSRVAQQQRLDVADTRPSQLRCAPTASYAAPGERRVHRGPSGPCAIPRSTRPQAPWHSDAAIRPEYAVRRLQRGAQYYALQLAD